MKVYKPLSQALLRLDRRQLFFIICFSSSFNADDLHQRSGIPKANIRRYIRYYQRRNMLHILGIEFCPITRRRTQLFTTNPQIRDNYGVDKK